MKHLVVAVGLASALAFVAGASAQSRSGESQAKEMEAVVKVTKVDRAARVAYVEAKGQEIAIHLPPETDIDTIREGSRYRVRYTEPVVTMVESGAQGAAAGATREAERTSAGKGVITAKVSGIVESVDKEQLALRTTEGQTRMFRLGGNVSTDSLKKGQAVTVTYQRPIATQLRSTPQDITTPIYAP